VELQSIGVREEEEEEERNLMGGCDGGARRRRRWPRLGIGVEVVGSSLSCGGATVCGGR